MFEKIMITIGLTMMITVLLLINVPFIYIGIGLINADKIIIGTTWIILTILEIIAVMFSILENLFED